MDLATKGAPQVILALSANAVAMKSAVDKAVNDFAGRGFRALAAVDSKAHDDSDQDQGEDNQVVADLQHGFLEMADGDRRLHEFRRLAEVGFAARRVDERADFAATNDRTGEDGVARFTRGGQGLPGQRRLVDGYLVAVQQA